MHSMQEALEQGAGPFVEHVLARLHQDLGMGGGVLGLLVDHVCWRCGSAEEYALLHLQLLALGTLLVQSVIGGRWISTFRLHVPVTYRIPPGAVSGAGRVEVVELAQAKSGSPYASGWEHAELVLPKGKADEADGGETVALSAWMARWPDLPWDCLGQGKARNADVRLRLPSPPATGQVDWTRFVSDSVSVKFHLRPLAVVIAHELAAEAAEARAWDPASERETPGP
jgi:predicted metalloenzyme YecM